MTHVTSKHSVGPPGGPLRLRALFRDKLERSFDDSAVDCRVSLLYGCPCSLSRSMSHPYIPTPSERTFVALGFMLCLCLSLAVLCLGTFHLYLVLSAQTTIEFHGNFSKRRKGNWKTPHSAGSWRKNWEMVYGTRFNSMGADSSVASDDDYRYKGLLGVARAMMPSSREPEFLPLPINGELVRRKHAKTTSCEESPLIDEEVVVTSTKSRTGFVRSRQVASA